MQSLVSKPEHRNQRYIHHFLFNLAQNLLAASQKLRVLFWMPTGDGYTLHQATRTVTLEQPGTNLFAQVEHNVLKTVQLDGADYHNTYGVISSGNSLRLNLVTNSNVGSRLYLLDSENEYKLFKLKNREFTFDVDVSKLPCGLNGALYFVEMDGDGGMSKYPGNKAGAKYGTGYCDAQCPRDIKFINGEANCEGLGFKKCHRTVWNLLH